MAGKLGDYNYLADDGINYKIRLDKSNAIALAVGYGLQMNYPALSSSLFLPKNITPRILYAYNRDIPRQKRRFVVGFKPIWDWLLTRDNPAIVSAQYSPDNAVGINTAWVITSWHAERRDRLSLRK